MTPEVNRLIEALACNPFRPPEELARICGFDEEQLRVFLVDPDFEKAHDTYVYDKTATGELASALATHGGTLLLARMIDQALDSKDPKVVAAAVEASRSVSKVLTRKDDQIGLGNQVVINFHGLGGPSPLRIEGKTYENGENALLGVEIAPMTTRKTEILAYDPLCDGSYD